jgi:hypothetical protein
MSDIAISLSPSGALTITESWKSGGRPQQVEIILAGDDVERLRTVLGQASPVAGTNAANWPAIAAYLLGRLV